MTRMMEYLRKMFLAIGLEMGHGQAGADDCVDMPAFHGYGAQRRVKRVGFADLAAGESGGRTARKFVWDGVCATREQCAQENQFTGEYRYRSRSWSVEEIFNLACCEINSLRRE